ncbi:cation:proton antiporter [Pontibacillus salicampi]|uniref:Cation:proton antiporter n=1 Tax=Pontibacillus salicampi TaxID=1449801 RepID=A0ABV6LPW4_9BACI
MQAYHFVILLFVGYLIFTLDKKKQNVPVPVILVLIGIGCSFVPFFDDVMVTKEIIYEIFLPALLFISAYRFPTKALKENAVLIGLMSTVGLLLTTILLGISIYLVCELLFPVSIVGALLMASMLTPTDPVSVTSILKQSGSNPRIADVVEGESMINDGTSIVLFTVFTSMYISNTPFSIFRFMNEFITVSLGGIVIGVSLGWAVSKAVHVTHHKQYQVMLSIILTYGTFFIAEHLHVSGVLATVAAGIMLSYEFEHTNKEDHFRESLAGFWDIVEPSILSLVFLLIGIKATSYLTIASWQVAFILFAATLLVRFLVISVLIPLVPKWRNQSSWKDIFIINWAGIKGTMSIALLLSLESQLGTQEQRLLAITFAVVLLSLVIQSVGIYPITRFFEKNKVFKDM